MGYPWGTSDEGRKWSAKGQADQSKDPDLNCWGWLPVLRDSTYQWWCVQPYDRCKHDQVLLSRVSYLLPQTVHSGIHATGHGGRFVLVWVSWLYSLPAIRDIQDILENPCPNAHGNEVWQGALLSNQDVDFPQANGRSVKSLERPLYWNVSEFTSNLSSNHHSCKFDGEHHLTIGTFSDNESLRSPIFHCEHWWHVLWKSSSWS